MSKNNFDKTFKDPFWDEFDEHTLKIRRNLFLSSSLAFFFLFNSIQFGEQASLDGVLITGLTTKAVYSALFFLVLYHFLHFFVIISSFYVRWKLKLTGEPHITDYNGQVHIRHATLYSWWVRNIDIFIEKEQLQKIEKLLQDNSSDPRLQNYLETIDAALNKITMELSQSRHIEKSLKNFNRTFWSFQYIQLLRWGFFETLLPILLGGVACGLLFLHIA